jgi:hypothetical protein
VIENAKTLVTKEKAGKFKPQRQNEQLTAALGTEEHRGCTRAISSIASWKEGSAEDKHMYKKRGRHDEDAEPANNNEEQFAHQFFNFLRKHPELVMQVPVPEVNLDIGTGFTPSSAGSALDKQKYPVDGIMEATPCTLLYVKGRTLKTIEVADAIVMSGRIMHGAWSTHPVRVCSGRSDHDQRRS